MASFNFSTSKAGFGGQIENLGLVDRVFGIHQGIVQSQLLVGTLGAWRQRPRGWR